MLGKTGILPPNPEECHNKNASASERRLLINVFFW